MTPGSSTSEQTMLPRIMYEAILADLKAMSETFFHDDYYWDGLLGNDFNLTPTEIIRQTRDKIILHHAGIYSEEIPDA